MKLYPGSKSVVEGKAEESTTKSKGKIAKAAPKPTADKGNSD